MTPMERRLFEERMRKQGEALKKSREEAAKARADKAAEKLDDQKFQIKLTVITCLLSGFVSLAVSVVVNLLFHG